MMTQNPELGHVTPVASYALFENERGELLICCKSEDDAQIFHTAVVLLMQSEKEQPVILLRPPGVAKQAETVLLGEVPEDYAARLLEEGTATIFCTAEDLQALDWHVPVIADATGSVFPPAESSEDAEDVGQYLADYMAEGAHCWLATGAELI